MYLRQSVLGWQDTFYWPVCHLCRVSGAIVSSSDHVNLDIYNLRVLMTINPSSSDILRSPGGCGQCLCHRCPHIYLTHRQAGAGRRMFLLTQWSGGGGGGGKYHQRHGHSLNKREQMLDLSGFVTIIQSRRDGDEFGWRIVECSGISLKIYPRICKY